MAGSPKKRAKREAAEREEREKRTAALENRVESEETAATESTETEYSPLFDAPVEAEQTPIGEWGSEYSAEEIEKLENSYARLSADYKGTISARAVDALKAICKCFLNRDKAMIGETPDSASAKRWQETADKIMVSEALKAQDAKPLEAIRVDKIARWLEQCGGAENGILRNKEQVLAAINSTRARKYKSIDLVDSMMLCIYNAGRVGRGISELTEIPAKGGMGVDDPQQELGSNPTKEEKELMMKTGVIAPKRG